MTLSIDEFRCRCCGRVSLDQIFFSMISKARVIADTPFVITSGYRCETHNKAVGSTSTNHTSGKAADISCTDGPSRVKILTGLFGAGFKRVGISKDFIHCDASDDVSSCWLY
jgi:zinc D-Ala-D-Ala carboxypeptidase